MIINRNNILEIVKKCGLNPDKDYGQNFLLEEDLCKRIIDSLNIEENDTILEIGPGLGSLTHFLSLHKNNITLVDIDKRMIDFLKIHYSSIPNITLINNDIRKEDVSSYTKIVANLPYNITSELIIFLLQNATKCHRFILMCQSETLAHFIDLNGKEYGPTSVLIHLLGDIKRLFTVKAGCFYPVPKCNSSVFEIVLNKSIDNITREKIIKVYNLSKLLFLNRRKTILNNLNQVTKNPEISKKILQAADINELKRPEEINYQSYIKIYEALNNFNEIK